MVIFAAIVSFALGTVLGYNLKVIFNQKVEAYVEEQLNSKKKTKTTTIH